MLSKELEKAGVACRNTSLSPADRIKVTEQQLHSSTSKAQGATIEALGDHVNVIDTEPLSTAGMEDISSIEKAATMPTRETTDKREVCTSEALRKDEI